MSKYLCYYLLFHFYYTSIFGYNVDTNFPMIYEDPHKFMGGRRSYFGYSILLSNSWIQIGAPRANFSTGKVDIKEPGVAYHCKFGKPWVQPTLGFKDRFSIYEKSWFGVAMDFQLDGDENIVVCGHRWMNVSQLIGIPGACYTFQPNQNLRNITNILTPTSSVDKNKRFLLNKEGKSKAYLYSLSQSGMSVHYSKADKAESSFLLGAPGYLNWKGTVVKYNDLASDMNTHIVANSYPGLDVEQFDLFGYQVSSGYFFSRNELMYVASAPRGFSLKGYVMIFKIHKSNHKLKNFYKIHGETTGEYFGSSMTVADITGDGLDDLIVGAPFFSRNGDEGRIYVIEFHKDRTLKKKENIDGKKENGKFGFAVASVGDLDHDGFADVAVGAPYEDNGVIYIYYGGSSGLKGSFQRITAESIHGSLIGFGNSFSGHADMDGNKYSDIAVGSFLSGHAVILRTRPVVSVIANISSLTHQVSQRAEILVCVYYNGTYNHDLNVTRRILADGTYRRVKPYTVHDTVLLNTLKMSVCQNYIFKVANKTENIHPSLEFRLSVYVTNTSTSTTTIKQPLFVMENGSIFGTDGFQYQDPIQGVSGVSSGLSLSIPFNKNCSDDICRSDLQLSCFLLENGHLFDLSKPYIMGSMAKYQLQIDVRNLEEPSYETYVEVKFPEVIRLSSTHFICDENEQIVNCRLGVVHNYSEKRIILDLDMSSVEELNTIDQTLLINVRVNSMSGYDLKQSDNSRVLVLQLSLDMDVHLYGKSQKENYVISKLDNGTFSSILEVVQVYEIHKKGLSPLKMLELIIEVPVNVTIGKEEIQIVSIYKPDAIIDGKYSICSVEFGCTDCQDISSRQIEIGESSLPENVRSKRSDTEDSSLKETALFSNRTLYINCSSEYVQCTTIKCQTTELEVYGKVNIRLEVNIAKLGPLMGQKDIVYVTSRGETNIINPDIAKEKNIQQKWPHVAEVSSIIIGKMLKNIVDLWVVVASAVGGILLAMFMTLGLAKAGFFQRKKKEELEELKEETRKSVISSHPMSNIEEEFDPHIELR